MTFYILRDVVGLLNSMPTSICGFIDVYYFSFCFSCTFQKNFVPLQR